MAIFGFQGLVTIIVMTFLQKIAKYYSLGRYILLDLVYYLHPSDDDLKKAAGLSSSHGKDKNKGNVRWRNKQNHKDNNEVSGSLVVSGYYIFLDINGADYCTPI